MLSCLSIEHGIETNLALGYKGSLQRKLRYVSLKNESGVHTGRKKDKRSV